MPGHYLSRGQICDVPTVKRRWGTSSQKGVCILDTKYRAFYIESERNELGLLLMCMYCEGDMDYLKIKNILIGLQ